MRNGLGVGEVRVRTVAMSLISFLQHHYPYASRNGIRSQIPIYGLLAVVELYNVKTALYDVPLCGLDSCFSGMHPWTLPSLRKLRSLLVLVVHNQVAPSPCEQSQCLYS